MMANGYWLNLASDNHSMANWLRQGLLASYGFAYRDALHPLLFRQDAQMSHESALRWLSRLDERTQWLRTINRLTVPVIPVTVGGVTLPCPMMLAAGFVKGVGFSTEADALAAVDRGENIIPGYRAMPALAGAIEFGSYTRYPRPGNPGTVIWRDVETRSTQNRVGLKNPGALAAARFLSRKPLPPMFGINIAISPGVTDPEQERREAVETVQAFLNLDVRPAWFTLNLSCPNTEDDPGANQTTAKAHELCTAIVAILGDIPLWVKISPDLAVEQYRALFATFEAVGVRAVIATNTLGQPTPDGTGLTAGVGGGRLYDASIDVVRLLMAERVHHGYTCDVIACGGVLDGATVQSYARLGVKAMQYWSALIYQGPLAAGVLASALQNG